MIDAEDADYGQIPVEALPLGLRAFNCLRRAQIETVADLASRSDNELMTLPNFGQTTLLEIRKALADPDGWRLLAAVAPPISHAALEFARLRDLFNTEQLGPNVTVHELSLPTRPRNALQRAKIASVGQLLDHDAESLLQLPNFGETSLSQVVLSLKRQYGPLLDDAAQLVDIADISVPEEPLPIDRLGLQLGSLNALHRAGIDTIEQLITKRPEELLALRNFGDVSLSDVTGNLEVLGLSLYSRSGWTSNKAREVPAKEVAQIEALRQQQEAHRQQQEEERQQQEEERQQRQIEIWPMFDEGVSLEDVKGRVDLTPGEVRRSREMWAVQRRRDGWTLKEIGYKSGVTKERARQIIARAGGPTGREFSETKRLKREEAEQQEAATIRADVRAHPGTTTEDAAKRVGVDPTRVQRALTNAEKKLIVDRRVDSGDRLLTWTRDALIKCVQNAATYNWPVTTNSYSALVEVGEIDGPTVATFYKRFGSWINACEAAGVEAGQTPIESYNRAWTEEDLYRYVCEYLLDPKTIGTMGDMGLWLAKRETAPSNPTIRNQLGGWQTIKAGAIDRLVASGELKEHGLAD
jgi:DNA-directed RNA polymerase alpha subunit